MARSVIAISDGEMSLRFLDGFGTFVGIAHDVRHREALLWATQQRLSCECINGEQRNTFVVLSLAFCHRLSDDPASLAPFRTTVSATVTIDRRTTRVGTCDANQIEIRRTQPRSHDARLYNVHRCLCTLPSRAQRRRISCFVDPSFQEAGQGSREEKD